MTAMRERVSAKQTQVHPGNPSQGGCGGLSPPVLLLFSPLISPIQLQSLILRRFPFWNVYLLLCMTCDVRHRPIHFFPFTVTASGSHTFSISLRKMPMRR
jgi:hypothetical protein